MNDNTPLIRILKLLFYLNYPFGRSLNDCLQTLDIKKATFYEYLTKLRSLGFFIDSTIGKYQLISEKSENDWFTKLFHISEEDAYLIGKAIDKLEIDMPRAQHLKQRLLKVFDTGMYADKITRDNENLVSNKLIAAIKSEKQVLLRNYHSGNSQTVTDRLVEPFEISDSFNLVWCYDVEKQMNKQFKISRINAIDVSPIAFEHKNKHCSMPTDVFRNTGILDKSIEIQLNVRAYNLLIEEYPMAEQFITELEGNSYLLQCKVAKWEGPCRFVLGLWDDIKLVGSNDFITFVKNKTKLFN
jgi:predicted DNA-binding transcriptional regulator YafY